MKKYLLLIITILFLNAGVSAQAGDGMQFHKGDWAAALDQAAKENKLVFLDAYTTWCGPCKKMTKEIFPQTAVGEFFNKHFVNVKMDMEKGEGIQIAQKHNVVVYPSLLFFSPDGTVVHRSAGYHTVPQFLELGAKANDPSSRLSSLDERYASGDRGSEFLFDYALAKYEVMDGSHGRIADEYLATQEDWSTEDNTNMIYGFVTDANSKMFDYIINNKSLFYDKFGEKEVTNKIQNVIYGSIQDSADKSSLDQVDELYKKVYPEKADQLSMKFRLSYYRQAGDRDNYAKSAIAYYKKYPGNDWDELNESAWTFYRVIDDKKLLKKALKWSKRSVKLDDNFFNNDTLAALYFKIGKKKKAVKTAKKAISMGQAAGEDTSATDELLAEILKL